MLKRIVACLGLHVCAIAIASAAWAHDMPDDYLPGTWGVGGAEACGGDGTEHITFDSDGTLKVVLAGQATATGFWHLVEDVLEMHMVSSPAFFDDPATSADDALQGFVGQYQYYYAKGLMFDIEPDAFRMVATMGDELRGADYGRCS